MKRSQDNQLECASLTRFLEREKSHGHHHVEKAPALMRIEYI